MPSPENSTDTPTSDPTALPVPKGLDAGYLAQMQLTVVIPTYNEAENLPLLVPQVLEQDPDVEVLVVDDSSPDGTGKLAEQQRQQMPLAVQPPHPVIGLITEWLDASGSVEKRSEESDLGGTMRLGGQRCRLRPDSLARRLYGEDIITERHRHRYEFNNHYRDILQKNGMVLYERDSWYGDEVRIAMRKDGMIETVWSQEEFERMVQGQE